MTKNTYDTLLIGGSGFIGSALAQALSEKGESVLSVSRNASDALPAGVEEILIDIGTDEIPVLPKVRTIFILVGQNSSDFDTEQELGALEKLITLCNRIHPEKILYLSSVLAYGEREKPAAEDDALVPIDPYSEYKSKAEALLKSQVDPGIHLGILRLANVYGSPKNRGFIGFLMKYLAAVSAEKIIVNGDGSQERDYIFLDDVVAALLAVRDGLQASDTVNIASGKSHTLLELIAAVGKVAKKELSYESGGAGGIEVNSSRIQNDKLRERYGFTPSFSLIQGLEKTLERYQVPKKRILFLGGEGFIGRNLISALSSQYQCFSVGERVSLFPERKAEFLQANPYQEKIEGTYDTVIHLIDHKVPAGDFRKEEERLVENLSLDPGTHLILFSSAVVYANPDSEYGERKRVLEEFYTRYCQERSIPLTIFRPFNVFGPFQMPYRQGSLVANLIYNSLMNRSTEINDMEARRDFVYAGDVARSVEEILLSPQYGIFDIGSGQLTSVRELISHLETILGKKIDIVDKGVPEEVQNQPVADNSWEEGNMVDLGEGLAQTVPFYGLYGTLIDAQKENS